MHELAIPPLWLPNPLIPKTEADPGPPDEPFWGEHPVMDPIAFIPMVMPIPFIPIPFIPAAAAAAAAAAAELME